MIAAADGHSDDKSDYTQHGQDAKDDPYRDDFKIQFLFHGFKTFTI
jgi:hypothetical protein